MAFNHEPNPFDGPNPMQPASAHPLALLDGQPISVEQAAERMEQLKTDDAFQKRVAAKDQTAFAEHTKLWRIAHGMTAEPETPINAVDVIKESIGRDLETAQVRAENLRGVGFNETQIYEYLNSRPIPFEERQNHERELARLRKDRSFVEKYFANDPDAVFTMRRVHAGLSMRVGSQEEIGRWEAPHKERKPK